VELSKNAKNVLFHTVKWRQYLAKWTISTLLVVRYCLMLPTKNLVTQQYKEKIFNSLIK